MIGSDLDRVLVVDDEPAIVDLMELYLRSDYEIIRAYNGKEALEKARSDKPSVIILDVMMPDMNGYEVCKVLKTSVETQFIPIIMVTALSGKDEKIKGLESGADEFLSKPVNRLELVTRVKSLTRIKHLQDRILAERNYAYQCIDVAGVIMVVVDREQKINLVNRTGNELLGYDDFELIGQNMFDMLFLPEEREIEKEKFNHIINNNIATTSVHERKILKKNGEILIVSLSEAPIYDSNGDIEAVIYSGKDITELKIKDELLLSLSEIRDIVTGVINQDFLSQMSAIQDNVQKLLEEETKIQNTEYIEKIIQNLSNMIETLKNTSAYLVDKQPKEKIQ
ncbi:MAG: response regulator [Methanomethylovorans sp.]|jgi:two-component system cell cycle response regulator|nr:response regulator [Methanomethylovorans sp.]